MEDKSGQTLGIVSVVLGAITFFIQISGGLICGWVGWPLGIGAIITGILAIKKGYKTLGVIGILLSVIGFVIQIIVTLIGGAALMSQF